MSLCTEMKRVLRELLRWGMGGVLCLLPAVVIALPAESAELPPAVDAAFRRYIALPDALLPVLEGVRDKQSAELAAKDLQALLPRVYEARRELSGIESLTSGEQRIARERYEQVMRMRWGKVFNHIFRLQRARCYGSPIFFKHFNTLCVMLEK